jgi:hypothetical protein
VSVESSSITSLCSASVTSSGSFVNTSTTTTMIERQRRAAHRRATVALLRLASPCTGWSSPRPPAQPQHAEDDSRSPSQAQERDDPNAHSIYDLVRHSPPPRAVVVSSTPLRRHDVSESPGDSVMR